MRATKRGVRLRASFDHVPNEAGLWVLCESEYADEATVEMRERAVRAAVADVLTQSQREAVELHFFEGLSQGEIARRLGVTQQVVQKRIYGAVRGGRIIGGALARLRHVLEPMVRER